MSESQCRRCKKPVTDKTAESCWYCMRELCFNCWDIYGHCGHPEADELNRKSKEYYEKNIKGDN